MRYTISLILTSLAVPAMADVPRVITDIPPVHALVAQVMGDVGQPTVLLDKGADAHSFQLRPSQAGALADADLVVWIGPEMTPWLDRSLTSLGDARQLRLLAAPGTYLQAFGAPDAAEGHEDHDHEAEPAEAAAHDDHAHDGSDPHAWLDPANAQHWLGLIAQELAAIDPENAATYAANATAAQAGIAAMDAEIAAILAPVKDKPFVVFHDAYGYYRGHYGLTVAGAIALGDATAPGAAHLADLQDRVAQDGVVCLFPESGHDPKQMAQLATAAGVSLGGVLDPEGNGFEPGPQLYADLMRGMATTLADCLTR